MAAIEEDGAEVITFGCSDVFWLQSFLQKRLNEMGWEMPVLEGYSSAIALAKLFVDLGRRRQRAQVPERTPEAVAAKESLLRTTEQGGYDHEIPV